MFTNEIEFDESITTVMDDRGIHEDIQIFIDENEVYIRQWNEENNGYDIVVMTNDMFTELQLAMNEGEGMFKLED